MLSVRREQLEGTCYIELHGEVDLATINDLRASLIEQTWGDLLIDCQHLEFIDSNGIALLSEISEVRRVELFHISEAFSKLLNLFDLEHLIPNDSTGKRSA